LARRYFIPPEQMERNEPLIGDADAHHLRDVLRLRPGAEITVFDGTGTDYRARLVDVSPKEVKVVLTGSIRTYRESPLTLTLAQGFLKDKKMDILVRQLTELGVTRWTPFLARRSVAVPTARRLEARQQRWEKISREAVKQCGRSRPMIIDKATSFERALADAQSSDLKLIFWESVSDAVPLEQFRALQPTNLYLMIGPEGGFEKSEIDQALANNFKPVRMGPRILRAETAALAAGVMIQFVFGDMTQKILDNSGGV